MNGQTMAEAIATGRGTERPFRCEQHEDTQASASVNVVKGVWFCHACHASGRVGDAKPPKASDIIAMLTPERATRVYPSAWLELFAMDPGDQDAYWHTRFAPWVCWSMGLGIDPFTSEAVFPVYTPAGKLSGVGRRSVTEKRYRYPAGWSASTQLGGTMGRFFPAPVVVLVEGIADAAAVAEVGALGLCQWGSQLHRPQIEMLARFNPRLVLLGQDMDEAGERGVSMAFKQLKAIAPMKRVRWSRSDPGATPPGLRRAALEKAVGGSAYGVDVIPQWDAAVTSGIQSHSRSVEEAAR